MLDVTRCNVTADDVLVILTSLLFDSIWNVLDLFGTTMQRGDIERLEKVEMWAINWFTAKQLNAMLLLYHHSPTYMVAQKSIVRTVDRL